MEKTGLTSPDNRNMGIRKAADHWKENCIVKGRRGTQTYIPPQIYARQPYSPHGNFLEFVFSSGKIPKKHKNQKTKYARGFFPLV